MKKIRCLAFLLVILFASSIVNPTIHGYNVDTHRALSYHAARRTDSGIEAFLVRELLMAEGLNTSAMCIECTNSGTKSLLEWIQEGSEREDDYTAWPAGRFFNHFYDPVSKQGLNDFIGNVSSGQKINSLSWAWGDKSVNNEWGWQQARGFYLGMLLTPIENNIYAGNRLLVAGRSAYMGATFRSLGHLTHLVQDLGQPQHTRNDAHTPLEGAPYENYCSGRYGTQDQVAGLRSEPLPQFSQRPPSRSLPVNRNIPQEIVNLWDTEKSPGNPTYYRGSLGLAEYSNAFFVTDDTMFSGSDLETFPLFPSLTVALNGFIPSWHVFKHPRLNNTSIGQQLLQGRVQLARAGESPQFPSNARPILIFDDNIPINLASFNFTEIFLTDENRESYAQKLLPKCISYSAALLKYFFRGKLSVSSNGVVEVKVGQRPEDTLQFIELVIRNESGKDQTIEAGTWALLTDTVSGSDGSATRFATTAYFTTQSQPGFPSVILNPGGYKGSLGVGESFTLWVPKVSGVPLPWETTPATLVFTGTLGNEKDIAVVSKRFRL